MGQRRRPCRPQCRAGLTRRQRRAFRVSARQCVTCEACQARHSGGPRGAKVLTATSHILRNGQNDHPATTNEAERASALTTRRQLPIVIGRASERRARSIHAFRMISMFHLDDVRFLPEHFDHHAAIEAIAAEAFGPGRFARAAERVREMAAHAADLSFVAEHGGEIIGSVRLTPIRVGDAPSLLLGPLAVRPDYKNRGVGKALMRLAAEAAREAQPGLSARYQIHCANSMARVRRSKAARAGRAWLVTAKVRQLMDTPVLAQRLERRAPAEGRSVPCVHNRAMAHPWGAAKAGRAWLAIELQVRWAKVAACWSPATPRMGTGAPNSVV